MSIIIDRRKNVKGKSSSNRRRFLKRVEDQIKKAIPNIVDDNTIEDLSNSTDRINIPIDGVSEPEFFYGARVMDDIIITGNTKFTEGDLIPKPINDSSKSKSGNGTGSGNGETGEDNFVVNISRDEFIQYFFKDLELPNIVKKSLEKTPDYKYRKAGYTDEGIPAKLNVEKSVKNALGRKIALAGVFDAKIKKLKKERKKESDVDKIKKINKEIKRLEKLKNDIPYIDEFDIKYNNYKEYPIPSTSCVMFCIMDVSGSMGYDEKDIAKRFFMLLYIFLNREYENIELIFIRHHTVAKEVDEKEFFTSRETGGTVVKSAFELVYDIMQNRYNNDDRNFYIAQVGDGDIWEENDGMETTTIIKEKILPIIQFMCYLEISNTASSNLSLSYYYNNINSKKFSQEIVSDVNEIWPVFKKFFKKK